MIFFIKRGCFLFIKTNCIGLLGGIWVVCIFGHHLGEGSVCGLMVEGKGWNGGLLGEGFGGGCTGVTGGEVIQFLFLEHLGKGEAVVHRNLGFFFEL